MVKGWNVTLASAIVAFALKQHDACYAVAGRAPVAVFRFLNAYFLTLEQGFRKLFTDAVARLAGEAKEAPNYNMTPDAFGPFDVARCALRPAVLLTHGPLAGMLLAIWIRG